MADCTISVEYVMLIQIADLYDVFFSSLMTCVSCECVLDAYMILGMSV